MGPLHGLPISLKDGFQIAGSAASIGFVSFLDRMSKTNSPLVDVLLDLGAVVYVKTNIPQTMMVSAQITPWPPMLGWGYGSANVSVVDSRLPQQHLRPHPQPPQHHSHSRRLKWRRRRTRCFQRLTTRYWNRHRRFNTYTISLLRHLRLQTNHLSHPLWRAACSSTRRNVIFPAFSWAPGE
jgi:hypothetical protein